VAVSPGIYNARGDRAGLAIEERRASTPVTRGSRPGAAGSIGDLVKDIISEPQPSPHFLAERVG
jgi:hypothetical protein